MSRQQLCALLCIGRRHLDLLHHRTPARVQPIRVRTNAFADGMPHRDVLLSPDHAVQYARSLIPIKLLLNGASILRDASRGTIVYYHLELDAHDILLAEGLPAESYLDTGNRFMFEDSGLPLVLHPDLTNDAARRATQSCLPFADDPETVEPVWRALAGAGGAVGLATAACPTDH